MLIVCRVSKEVFSGEKILCLAITEPDAGSDVASLATEAVLSPDGKHYVVNGQKKVCIVLALHLHSLVLLT